jgi:tRNA G18 (ribose-2'-O)-methylase SpoU
MKRGYYGIGIYHPKTPVNLGTLWRSAHNFGATFIFVIGSRYKIQSSDTTKAYRHIPLFTYKNFAEFNKNRPYDCPLIAIEQSKKSKSIKQFVHPERAMYLLGAEDHGISPKILNKCQSVIHIDSPMCLNVAVAGSIIMFDRNTKSQDN